MSARPIVGHGPGQLGYAFSFVDEKGVVNTVSYVCEQDARWLYNELGHQLGSLNAWKRVEELRAQVDRLERSNAALRGALKRRGRR